MKRNGRVVDLLNILALIELTPKTSVNHLVEKTGISRSALLRLLKVAREELNVVYVFVRSTGYVVTDWGVLDRTAVLTRCSETNQIPVKKTKNIQKSYLIQTLK